MSWPRQGSQNSLEKPKFERKSWISWDWGRACQGKLGGCPPPNLFTTARGGTGRLDTPCISPSEASFATPITPLDYKKLSVRSSQIYPEGSRRMCKAMCGFAQLRRHGWLRRICRAGDILCGTYSIVLFGRHPSPAGSRPCWPGATRLGVVCVPARGAWGHPRCAFSRVGACCLGLRFYPRGAHFGRLGCE